MPKRKTTKLTGLMAEMASTRKKPTTLLGDIQTHILKKSQHNPRRTDVIHPSELAKDDVCPRRIVKRIQGKSETDLVPPNGVHLETIFQEGHDIHSKWQSWLGEMERLWGKWVCPACETQVWGLGQRECSGPISDGHPPVLMTYAEVPLDAEEQWLISGHADGAVPDLQAMIEVKSIGMGTLRMDEPELVKKYMVTTEDGKRILDYDALWKGLQHPLRPHRIQASLYLSIAQLLGWDYDKMIFIYENKANQQTKEFVTKLEPSLVEPLLDVAKDIKWAVENDRDLPIPRGFTLNSKPCSECPYRSLCFNDETMEERDAGDGARKPRSQARDGEAADLPSGSSRRGASRSAGRSDRPGRQRTDEPVHRTDAVERVPRQSTRSRRGGREVRRSSRREG